MIVDRTAECRELYEKQGKKYKLRDLKRIDHIVLHRNEVGADAVSIARAFAERDDIKTITGGQSPYHFVVQQDGTVEQALPLSVVGAHVHGYNTPSVGIVCVGDFRTHKPAYVQWLAAAQLAQVLCDKLNVKVENVKGHDEYPDVKQYKECPGHLFDMNLFRNELGKWNVIE